jgi:hypothetical protein
MCLDENMHLFSVSLCRLALSCAYVYFSVDVDVCPCVNGCDVTHLCLCVWVVSLRAGLLTALRARTHAEVVSDAQAVKQLRMIMAISNTFCIQMDLSGICSDTNRKNKN